MSLGFVSCLQNISSLFSHPKACLTICLGIGHLLDIFGEMLSTVAWPPSCVKVGHTEPHSNEVYRKVCRHIIFFFFKVAKHFKQILHDCFPLHARVFKCMNSKLDVCTRAREGFIRWKWANCNLAKEANAFQNKIYYTLTWRSCLIIIEWKEGGHFQTFSLKSLCTISV